MENQIITLTWDTDENMTEGLADEEWYEVTDIVRADDYGLVFLVALRSL